MASSLPLKRFLSSTPLSRSFLRPVASSAARSFNTNVLRQYDSDVDRRSDRRSPRFSLINRREDLFRDVIYFCQHPFLPAARGGWDRRETEDAMHLRVNMPFVGKQDEISVKHNTLTVTIKGEGANKDRCYTHKINLPDKLYKFDQIKTEMKNCGLKNCELEVVVPKRKKEEIKV